MFNNEVNMRRIMPHKNKYIFLMCLMCEGGRPRFWSVRMVQRDIRGNPKREKKMGHIKLVMTACESKTYAH